jgi:hypothetical protein
MDNFFFLDLAMQWNINLPMLWQVSDLSFSSYHDPPVFQKNLFITSLNEHREVHLLVVITFLSILAVSHHKKYKTIPTGRNVIHLEDNNCFV